MKSLTLSLVLLAAAVIPVVAQKIDTETSDRTRIVHLKTALNHLTVIEVSEAPRCESVDVHSGRKSAPIKLHRPEPRVLNLIEQRFHMFSQDVVHSECHSTFERKLVTNGGRRIKGIWKILIKLEMRREVARRFFH